MNVKELRQLYKITQDALSAGTGIPRDRIAKWEQGKGTPKSEDAFILQDFFNKKREEVSQITGLPISRIFEIEDGKAILTADESRSLGKYYSTKKSEVPKGIVSEEKIPKMEEVPNRKSITIKPTKLMTDPQSELIDSLRMLLAEKDKRIEEKDLYIEEKDKRIADRDDALKFARSMADSAMKQLLEAQEQLSKRLDDVLLALKGIPGEFQAIELDLTASREFFAMQFAKLQNRSTEELLSEYGTVEVAVYERAGQ